MAYSASTSAGVISTVTNDLTAIGSVIAQVETIFAGQDGTGPQKFKAATALVGPIIMTSQPEIVGQCQHDEVTFRHEPTSCHSSMHCAFHCTRSLSLL